MGDRTKSGMERFGMTSKLIPLIRSLSLAQDRTADLGRYSSSEWEQILPLSDHTQLTLPIAVRAIHHLPGATRQRLERSLADNAERHRRTLIAYEEIATEFRRCGIEWIVLKGFSQQPNYCASLEHRPQYDLDFYCPPDSMPAAFDAVTRLGYEPFRRMNSPTDHLPPLIRKTGWQPGTDYFDPEMPFTVELHHRFWDPDTEHFHTAPTAELWARRVTESYRGIEFPALCAQDRFSYATWHLVRHLLRGDLRPYHVYEIAYFLHATATDDVWWRTWSTPEFQSASSRQIAGITFRLARDWFDCALHPEAELALTQLPDRIQRWFNIFGLSPLTTWEQPNKDELFLHLELVPDFRNRCDVTRRRLIPTRFQPPVLNAHEPHPSKSLRWKRRLFGSWFILKRAAYHLRALLPLVRSATLWAQIWPQPRNSQSPRRLRVENDAR